MIRLPKARRKTKGILQVNGSGEDPDEKRISNWACKLHILVEANAAYLKSTLEYFLDKMNVAIARGVFNSKDLRRWRRIVRSILFDIPLDLLFHLGE